MNERDQITGTRPHPVGTGLMLTGAAAAVLALFLPLAQSSTFSSVEGNTLIQSASGVEFVVLAIWLAVLGYRYVHQKRSGWGALVAGTLIVATAIYYGVSDDLFTLYSLDPTTGAPITAGPSQRASVGIALYVAGFGGALAVVGGWMVWRHSETTDPAPAGIGPAMKRCPECAEDIRAEARVCRFCGCSFTGWAPPDARA